MSGDANDTFESSQAKGIAEATTSGILSPQGSTETSTSFITRQNAFNDAKKE
ncbi:MAG: hypothetical protein HQK91_01710 [Nitrospirae bacterium]|nr:hypothetical protein [Nitrospirota bacterium]